MIIFEEVAHRYAVTRSAAARSGASMREAVLDGVNFHLGRGQLGAVIGASGSGKTTLLKLVNRLLEPASGRVLVGGEDVARRDPIALRRSIGYVFQRFGLFPHMTLAENVTVGPRLSGWPPRRAAERADELLGMVGLPPDSYRGRYPSELSGGQQQRVGLARALATQPQIMLMDEPFGSLDPLTRADLQVSYRRLHDELALTTLLVTHDVTEALLMADLVLVLHEGTIAHVATPRELLTAPPSREVSRLLDVPRQQMQRLEALASSARP
jgi:osmoprotectant transport system ATP-binding protein